MRRSISLLTVSSVALVAAACGGGHSMTGTFTLLATSTFGSGAECHGTGGYADIRDGVAVTVKDEAGTIIGTGNLAASKDAREFGCEYAFTVAGLPDAEYYEIEVSHRGGLTYSRSELDAMDWTVDASLGS